MICAMKLGQRAKWKTSKGNSFLNEVIWTQVVRLFPNQDFSLVFFCDIVLGGINHVCLILGGTSWPRNAWRMPRLRPYPRFWPDTYETAICWTRFVPLDRRWDSHVYCRCARAVAVENKIRTILCYWFVMALLLPTTNHTTALSFISIPQECKEVLWQEGWRRGNGWHRDQGSQGQGQEGEEW